MANIKISELNEIVKKSYDDVIPIVDVSANETKKISVEDLTANGVELIAVVDTAPSTCSTGDKYYNTTTNKIYTATGEDTWGTIGEDPIEGIMYVVFDSQTAYAYNGTTLISVGGGSGDLIVVGTDEPTEDTKLQIESMDLDFQESEEYVLYDNSSGTTGPITLNDSASNYTCIEIEYCRNGNNFAKSTGKIHNYNAILLDGYFTYYDEGASALVWQIFQEVINISGTSLTRNDTYYTNFFASSYVASSNFTNGVIIKRVVGYK